MFARRCATVRNRPREGHIAVPMVNSAKGVTFRAFQRRVASFRVALRDIPTCFTTCQKFFVWQAQYFCDVFKRCVAFFVAEAALWRHQMSFCAARTALSTCRAAYFFRIAMSRLREVVTLTTPHSTLHTLHSRLHTANFTLYT